MNRLQELQQLQIEILLEDCDRQLRDLLKNATVEPVVDEFEIRGFWVHGCKSSVKTKPEDQWISSAVTLAGEGFWVAHPFHDHILRFVGEWLLTAESISLSRHRTLDEPIQLSIFIYPEAIAHE